MRVRPTMRALGGGEESAIPYADSKSDIDSDIDTFDSFPLKTWKLPVPAPAPDSDNKNAAAIAIQKAEANFSIALKFFKWRRRRKQSSIYTRKNLAIRGKRFS